MKRILLLLATLGMISASVLRAETYEQQMASLAQSIANAAEAAGKKRIAVMALNDLQNHERELGAFLAEELSVDLINIGVGKKTFSVVDRQNMKTLLAELKIGGSGAMDQATVEKLGQISGADAFIVGNITELQDEFSISIKLIGVRTSENFGADRKKFSKTKETVDLWNRSIARPQEATPKADPEISNQESNSSSPAVKIDTGSFTKDVVGKTAGTEHEQFDIKSIKRDKDGTITISIAIKNINTDQLDSNIRLNEPAKTAYLVDDIGNDYAYSTSVILTEKDTLFRPGALKLVELKFAPVTANAKSVSLYFEYTRKRSNRSPSTERLHFDGLSIIK